MASKVQEASNSFSVGHDWRKIGYDDTYEDAQLLHTLQKRLKKEDDPDYEPDLNVDGDSPRQSTTPVGQYFQKPIFQCPECVRSYKSPVRMANHYRDKHPDKDHRTPYSRYPSQRDKRNNYDYPSSPTRSPITDDLFPYCPSYDYSHKHNPRHLSDRERFTANENTQIVTYSNKMAHRTVSNNILYSNNNNNNNNNINNTIQTRDTTMIESPNASPLAVVPRSRTPTPPSDSSSPSPSLSPSLSPSSSSSNSPTIIPSSSPHSSTASFPSPSSSYSSPSSSSSSSSSSRDNNGRTINVKGRTYDCKGIRISSVVDEIKFIDCLEKNKQRLHLASIAHNQGLISSEEYSRKQREFVSAFSFF